MKPAGHEHDSLETTRKAAFAKHYAQHQNVVQAAIAAGIPPWLSLSVGMSWFAKIGIQQLIIRGAHGDIRLQLAERFDLDPITGNIVDPPTLAERIAAARADLAYQARGNLPEPAELVVTRPPLSRRARAARHAAAAARAKEPNHV